MPRRAIGSQPCRVPCQHYSRAWAGPPCSLRDFPRDTSLAERWLHEACASRLVKEGRGGGGGPQFLPTGLARPSPSFPAPPPPGWRGSGAGGALVGASRVP